MCLESELSTGSSKLCRKREKPGDSVSSFTESTGEKSTRKTITKTKKGATTRNLSSLKVFEEFVTYFPPSEFGSKQKRSEVHDFSNDEGLSLVCDASGILSKECFDKWVETRTSKPKYPEESFRRAITAHIRGSDGRRPFSPIIEKALLIELRKKKIWPCFAHLQNKIGVLGYQKLGYHESLSLKANNDSSNTTNLVKENSSKSKKQRKELQIRKQQPSSSSSSNVGTNHIPQSNPIKSIESNHGHVHPFSGTIQQQQSQNQISLASSEHHPLHGFMNPIHINQNLMGGTARDGAIRAHATGNANMGGVIHHMSQNVGAPSLTLPESTGSAPGVDRKQFLLPLLPSQSSRDVSNMFRKYDVEAQLDQFMPAGRNQGANAITSSTNFMLNQQQSLSDPRLQESFLIPDPSTVSFDPHKPKGIVNIDNTTHACLQMDGIAKSLFGGDITGYNAFVLSCSKLAMLKQTSIGFRNLQLTGETWMHIHLRRISDSKPVILLTHMVKAGPNETKAVLQDVSERHKYILDLPPNFF